MDKSLLRQAQQLQEKMTKVQQELGEVTLEASSGGGAVKVVIDGHQKVRSVEIAPGVITDNDVELLQDMVMTAMNEAIQKSQELASKRFNILSGGLNIPGV